MKKTLTLIVVTFCLTSTFAQTQYTLKETLKENKEKIVAFSISANENEKHKIDWNLMNDVFADENPKDSIQISVKFNSTQFTNLKKEDKYTVRGIKENLNQLIDKLKTMID